MTPPSTAGLALVQVEFSSNTEIHVFDIRAPKRVKTLARHNRKIDFGIVEHRCIWPSASQVQNPLNSKFFRGFKLAGVHTPVATKR